MDQTDPTKLEDILKKAGVKSSMDTLASQLNSEEISLLLTQVLAQRAASLNPSQCLAQFEAMQSAESKAPLNEILDFDRLALSLLPKKFQISKPNVFCPLGSSMLMGRGQPITVGSNFEVTSGVAIPLALQVAHKRQQVLASGNNAAVYLGCPLNEVRLDGAGQGIIAEHIFALATGGDANRHPEIVIQACYQHICFYLSLLDCVRSLRLHFHHMHVVVQLGESGPDPDAVHQRLVEELEDDYPRAEISLDSSQHNRRELGFQIMAANEDGEERVLATGGLYPFSSQLLEKDDEFLILSQFNTSVAYRYFRNSGGCS